MVNYHSQGHTSTTKYTRGWSERQSRYILIIVS